ncbi:ead/Ea22-like family protein, partial [Escherichia coli]|uniref:ead/Ea22-like family protein n=1 Tax=Escherichia coli TaxID=562 RepID=UPI00385051B8
MAGPETVLSLLDERDALNERIAELEANLAKLAEDQQKDIESNKQADSAVKLAHEKFSALAAENAELKAFKTAVYQQMGVGCDAPEFSITVGLSNLRRFADTLHAIEREFFTKELPDEEHEGETFNECPLSWGMSVEQYVS